MGTRGKMGEGVGSGCERDQEREGKIFPPNPRILQNAP